MFKSKRLKKAEKPSSIQDLYPELNSSEQEEAELFFNRYIDLIEKIDSRIESEGKADAELHTIKLREEWEKRSK